MQFNLLKSGVFLTLILFLSAPHNSFGFLGFGGSHKTVKAKNGEVILPLKKINDGKAHHYTYKSNGKEINFFVVMSRDGVIRAAFDACDVCFPAKKGYTQQGDYMICNNCGRKFHSARINVVKGGCNPAPLNRAIKGDNLVIRVDDILSGGGYF